MLIFSTPLSATNKIIIIIYKKKSFKLIKVID